MRRGAQSGFPFLLLPLLLLVPLQAGGRPQYGSTYGPLPVFELHSGFWVNLHHTLYHEARQRAAASPPDNTGKASGPCLDTPPEAQPALPAAAQRSSDDA